MHHTSLDRLLNSPSRAAHMNERLDVDPSNWISSGVRVYVLDKPHFSKEANRFLTDNHTKWRKETAATDAEKLIEFAGRICYMSFGKRQSGKTTSEYIRYLIDQGHESVLEHASWTFVLTGITRSFSHQLVRHRVGFSFSQLSQQYHDESNARFVLPYGLDHDEFARSAAIGAFARARKAYSIVSKALKADQSGPPFSKAKRERLRHIRSVARSVLPNATETSIAVTANARALRHFLAIRGTIPGDIEMRVVCAELLKKIRPDAPAVFFNFRVEQAADGYPILLNTASKPSRRRTASDQRGRD